MADSVLEVSDLTVAFPHRRRRVGGGEVTVVDRVSLNVAPGEIARPGRRVRLAEVDDGARSSVYRPARAASCSTASTLTTGRPRSCGRCAAHAADGVPGPLLLAQPAR